MPTSAYIRVSSKAQDYAMQRSAIERILPAGSVPADVEWFTEKQSAKTNDRPELLRLMKEIRAGRFDRLIVFRLDRLCRTGSFDTFTLVGEIRNLGVTLISVADNVTIRPNKDDTVSEVLVFALGLAARLERTAINDRIAAARVHMEAKGERWGRPPRVSPDQRATIARMLSEGRTVREISAAVGIPRATVGRAVAKLAAQP